MGSRKGQVEVDNSFRASSIPLTRVNPSDRYKILYASIEFGRPFMDVMEMSSVIGLLLVEGVQPWLLPQT